MLLKRILLIIEHNFNSESIGDLCCIAESFNVPISMIYVTTKDYKNHEKLWRMKSEEELEHPGHCASYYMDGKTSGHNLDYNKMISEEIAIIDDCLEIEITFKPFNRNKSLEEVIDFIRR